MCLGSGLLLPSKAQREYKEMLGLQKGDARARRQPETGPPAPTPQQQETPDVSHPEAVERRAREAAAAAANPEPANEEPADAAAPDEVRLRLPAPAPFPHVPHPYPCFQREPRRPLVARGGELAARMAPPFQCRRLH